jgi:hypothetical protein
VLFVVKGNFWMRRIERLNYMLLQNKTVLNLEGKLMLKSVISGLLTAILCLSTVLSQDELYIPTNIKKGFENGTRSFDGKPGKNYWQNRSDYSVKVELIPKQRKLVGDENISYQNNSPDSLKNLYLKIYQDIYKKGTMRDFSLDSSDIHPGTIIHYILVNEDSILLSGDDSPITRTATLLRIKLDKPLPPGEDLDLSLGWETTLPATSHLRMGAYGDSAFFVAHWFPRIAVYDDVDGWDMYPYSGTQEFYNDFGDFEVEITVPGDFIVWGTGIRQNLDQVLDEKYIDRYEEASESDSIINIVSAEDYLGGSIPISNEKNIWKFEATNVPDFAFATANCYLWDATSLIVDAESERRVIVDAAYRQNSEDFYEVAKIGRQSIEFLSTEMPGYPFPYPKMTVFNGSGGMEFPMMVNDGTTSTRPRTIGLTSHEIAHTYFPFFMGTNEKKYAWMDEGWAVMLNFDFQNKMTDGINQVSRELRTYSLVAGRDIDLPMMIPSIFMRGRTYRNAAYSRPAIAYYLLRNLMGDDKFKEALHLFINRWNGKHPIPYDFFFTFDQVNGESLKWFWNPWFFERGYADLAIKDVTANDDENMIIIEKLGLLPVPIKLKVAYADSSEEVITHTADVWKSELSEYKISVKHNKEIVRIELGNNYIPDIDKKNNMYYAP